MPDLVLSIFVTGPPDHARYLVASPDLEFWTGNSWTDEESEARLYASVNDAALAIQEILLTDHGDKPLRQFVAPVYVDVFSDSDLTPAEIRDWLSKTARLTVDAERHGNGPREETLGLLHIQWSQLREIEHED